MLRISKISALLGSAYVWRILRFTLLQACLSTLLSAVFGVLVARAFARETSFPGRRALLGLMSLPIVLPSLVAVFGIIPTGVYLLRAVKGAFFGPRNPRWDGLVDAKGFFRRLPFVFLILVLLLFGFWPRLLTDVIGESASELAALLARAGGG
jgi:ABC-type Fe3+ transport system permease subunit